MAVDHNQKALIWTKLVYLITDAGVSKVQMQSYIKRKIVVGRINIKSKCSILLQETSADENYTVYLS